MLVPPASEIVFGLLGQQTVRHGFQGWTYHMLAAATRSWLQAGVEQTQRFRLAMECNDLCSSGMSRRKHGP